MTTAPRKRKKVAFTDTFLGVFIPVLFAIIAGYQEIHDGKIDKYVIGALLVFGLGSLGWRIDVIAEKYLESRIGRTAVEDESKDDSK